MRSFENAYTDFISSFTFDMVSQLDRDTLTALAAIREWRNSFVRINRIPLDILFLIPHPSLFLDPRRTASAPVLYAAAGAEPSSNVHHYGPSYASQGVRSTSKLSSSARKGPCWMYARV